jgi:hypothetical protein
MMRITPVFGLEKKALVALAAFVSVVAFGQEEKPFFLKKFDGTTLRGTTISYERPIMKEAVFLIDSVSYPASEIEFIQNHHGLFGNLNRFYKDDSDIFAMRIKRARISIFEEVDMYVYGAPSLRLGQYDGDASKAMIATGDYFHFYSKDDGPLKKANFKNLKSDLSDKPEANHHLKRHQRYLYLQLGLLAGGLAIITADVLSQPKDDIRMTPFNALGLVVIGGSFFPTKARKDSLWDAVEAYNAY